MEAHCAKGRRILDQSQCQLSAITALVLFKEALKTGRRVGHLQISAPPDFVCYVRRYIAGPVLDGIEANTRTGLLY
jgi:hypothetical protein